MLIKSIEISGFKSIDSLKMDFDKFTSILGSNNAGKSTILRAIEIFFEAAPKISVHDHFGRDTSKPILITITFSKLTPSEMEEFSSSIVDQTLTITREVSSSDRIGGYAIYRKSHPNFQDFYNEPSKAEKRKIYAKIQKQIQDLAAAPNAESCEENLVEYENQHPEQLVALRMKGFLGAVNIANGIIRKKTNYIVVPAVKDGSDFETEKTSPVVALLNTITKQTLDNKADLQSYLEEARNNISDLANPEDEPKLNSISSGITEIVSQYYSGATVDASWDKSDIIQINYPKASISVSHRGVDLPIQSLGHGLQRVLIFSVLQYLARSQSLPQTDENNDEKVEFEEPLSDIIIAIEEPEIYQHPIKQRQIYKNIRSLVEGFDKLTGIRIQVIYTTHSEKMIALSDFNALRVVRKITDGEEYRTICSTCEIKEISEELANLLDPPAKPFSDERFLAALHIFTDEISEGFFADRIILVEGVSDKAILSAAYLSLGRSADDDGIAIIRTDGKTKLDKPAVIFKKFGIPVYVLFDSDKKDIKNNAAINKILQKICESPNPEEYPDGSYDLFCSVEGNMNDYIDQCLGELKDEIYTELSENWGLNKKEIAKSPSVISSLFKIAEGKGIKFPLIYEIIEKVDSM